MATVRMTPSEAMMTIYGVLNKLPHPYPLVETAEKIAFKLGFDCIPTKTKGDNK